MIKPKERKRDAYAEAVTATAEETHDLVARVVTVTQKYRNIHFLRVFYATFPSHRLMHIGPWQSGDGDHFIHITKLMALLYQDEITSKALEHGQLRVGIVRREVNTTRSRIAFRVYTEKHTQQEMDL